MPPELFTPSPGPDGLPHELQPKWRRDFPIDVPQDNYVARRDFVKFMLLTSGAFVVGQLWIGLDSLRRRATGRPAAMEIARVAAVPVGGVVEFHYPTDNDPCLLVRPAEDTILAYSQVCTHLSCAVQPEMKLGKFHCPCHNGWFDMASGRPTAGPPRRPLPKIVLEIKKGVIYATGVEVST
jgi:nitrite reductase/ring-hydroxylating ferredoxin subunit